MKKFLYEVKVILDKPAIEAYNDALNEIQEGYHVHQVISYSEDYYNKRGKIVLLVSAK